MEKSFRSNYLFGLISLMVLFSCQKEQNNPQPPEIIEIQPGAELGCYCWIKMYQGCWVKVYHSNIVIFWILPL